jgi:hypothetical protein
VNFYGLDAIGGVVAAADTNNDLVPDMLEAFLISDDAQNDIPVGFAFSKRSGNFYTGFVAASGPNQRMGKITISTNPNGDFRSVRQGGFSLGQGAPIGMVVIDSPRGDILIVASIFYAQGLLDAGSNDTFTLTAFLPGANGVPDGNSRITLLGAGSTLGSAPINSSLGGIALDAQNNLYVNVITKTAGAGGGSSLGGAILAFQDTDNDSIPNSVSVFSGGSGTNLNALTAASIAAIPRPGGGTRLVVYGVTVFQGQNTQIVFYDDADGDLRADGAPVPFFTGSNTMRGAALSFGAGTSSPAITHMDFAGGQAVISFFGVNGQNIDNSGLAVVKDDGTGRGGAPIVFVPGRMGNNVLAFTSVNGVPVMAVPDTVAPSVRVTSPNGGETVNDSQLAIRFTSSDDQGVMTHDINLSTDGGNTFAVPIVRGLGGNNQLFNFVLPAGLNSTRARVQVIARDGAGNMAMDTSDADFSLTANPAADMQAPTVRITAPTVGQSLNAGTMVNIAFSSTDNVVVTRQNIRFAADGSNFNVTLASGLAGSANAITFVVPSTPTNSGAIQVEAFDAAGNRGVATVGMLRIIADTMAPTVTVTSPRSGERLQGGRTAMVSFTSTDNAAVAMHEIQISLDGGATFMPLANGIPGNAQSFTINVPNMKTKRGVIRVIARDSAGNAGSGNSGTFRIKRNQ